MDFLRYIYIILLSCQIISCTNNEDQLPWKSGTAKTIITPQTPVWLAGYGWKRVPEGTLHDLWVKVLALEDSNGYRAVVMTSDLMGIPKYMYENITQKLMKKFHLERSQIMLTFSHNHCAPRLSEDLVDYYPEDSTQTILVKEYSDQLEIKIIETVTKAFKDLSSARVYVGEGTANFAVNRRNNIESEVAKLLADGIPLNGPVDHSVPVMAIYKANGRLETILFGYACHPTTLNFLKWCGDYPGFAQIELEKNHPGTMALFFTGCGADQNPLPRREVALCMKYGSQLAVAVDKALEHPLRRIPPDLRTAFEFVDLDYLENPTRKELEEAIQDTSQQNRARLRARWAKRMLKKIEQGKTFAPSYPYPVQVWRLGGILNWIGLGGEAVVDYALRFKKQYGEDTWICGYANYLVAYIPSDRVYQEGGYEGGPFIYEYGHPADRWAGDVEERVVGAVDRLVKKVTTHHGYGAESKKIQTDMKQPESQDIKINHQKILVYYDNQGQEHPVKTVSDWQKRRQQILEGMQKAMGQLPSRENLLPFEVQLHESMKTPGFERRHISIVTEKNYRLHAYLFIPNGLKTGQKIPAILALHPTHYLGKGDTAGLSKRENRGYGLELAQHGYVVLVPDYPSFGDDSTYDFSKDRYVSGTMKGIFNHMRCIDYLCSLPMVDSTRLGVIGHSLGGHNAMFVSVFDKRLKVIVSSCGWTPFHDYYGGDITGWTSTRYMPLLRDQYQLDPDRVPFDFYEVVAALAPRAFFSNSPLRDGNFDVNGVKKAIPVAAQIYRLYNTEDKIQVRYPDCEHDFPPEIREEAYRFMDRILDHTPSNLSDFRN